MAGCPQHKSYESGQAGWTENTSGSWYQGEELAREGFTEVVGEIFLSFVNGEDLKRFEKTAYAGLDEVW